MNFQEVIPLLTAFGLGSIVTVTVQAWLSRKGRIEDRSFSERKEAYMGLLQAYHRAAAEPSDAASKDFAYWQLRCELVAPESVRDAIAEIVATNDDKYERYKAHKDLKAALRKDLAITKG